MKPVLEPDGKGGWVINVVADAGAATAPAADANRAAAPAAASTSDGPPLSGGTAAALQRLGNLNFDRPIGEVPAFTALGISPDIVAHPSSPRELGAALLNGTDREGVLQTGLAIETAPFRLLGLAPKGNQDYRDSYFGRLLYNSSLSLATAKASEEDEAVQLAIGYSAILFQDDDSDPIVSPLLDQAFAEMNATSPMGGVGRGGAHQPVSETANSIGLKALEKFREQIWAARIWSAAIAPTWTSKEGDFSGLESTGFSAWTTFAWGTKDALWGENGRMQFLAHVLYRQGELVTDAKDTSLTASQDSLVAAARVRFGNANFHGFAEAGYSWIWDGLQGDGEAWRAAAGVEKRIAKDTWLVISAGQEFGGKGGKSEENEESFAVGSLRFGLADEPSLDMSDAK